MAKRRRKKGSSGGPSRVKKIRSGIKRGITTAGKKARRTADRLRPKDRNDASSARRTQRSTPPAANSRDKKRIKPKLDLGEGRLVYPRKGDDGKTRYLPRESAATRDELKKGLFIKMAQKEAREIDPNLKRKFDIGKGRFIYPVKEANGKISYMPRESEASDVEIENGAFVKDKVIVQKVAENLKAKYDLGKGRYVFPVEGPNKKVEYLPKKDDANDFELSNGLYVKNEDVAEMEPKTEKRIRRVTPKSKAKPEPPALDEQGRRNLFTRPISKAKDGTGLWNSRDIPGIDLSRERPLLRALKPKYDLGKQRMIYPVQSTSGKTEYLPLKDEATEKEIKNGAFAEFVPPDGLQKLIRDKLPKDEIDVEGGKIKAIKEEDLANALSTAPELVLKSHKSVLETFESDPWVRQEWV